MLHELVKYADREGLVARPGFKPKFVRWLLVFSPDGKFLGVQDLTGGDPKSKGQEFPQCPDLTDVELKSVLDGKRRRHFLVDSAGIATLFAGKDKPDEKLIAQHEHFVEMLKSGAVAVPELAAIADSLARKETSEAIHARLTESKARPTDSVTFAITSGGETWIPVQRDDWHAWWSAFRAALVAQLAAKRSPKGRAAAPPSATASCCFLTGGLVEPVVSHLTITGLSGVGGQSSGDRLISFYNDSFASFGLKDGLNAAMSEQSVSDYSTALNHLILKRSRQLAGVKIAYWYSGRVPQECDVLDEMLGGMPWDAADADEEENAPPDPAAVRAEIAGAESRARHALDAIRTGDRPELGGLRYYALTLSANSGRVIVRNWMEGIFGDLVKAVQAWFDDLAITSLGGSRLAASPRLENVVTCVLPERKKSQNYGDWTKSIGGVRDALWRCAMLGRVARFPESVVKRALLQHHNAMINGEFNSCLDRGADTYRLRRSQLYCRLGILKAFLVRNNKGDNTMLTYLNPDLDDPAYQFGRLVAVLADLQRAAMRKESGESVKVSVVDRFYTAASTSPRLVHGRLTSLSNHHLRKLEQEGDRGRAAARAIRNRIAEISMCIDPANMPAMMTLDQQSRFSLGYYHQVAQMNRDRLQYAARKEATDAEDSQDDA